MLIFSKKFYAFFEDPINYILCNFQLVIHMFSTILMPTKIGPGFGSGSQALVPASIPSHKVSPGAEAIRTTVVPIRILIRTTVVPITPLIGTTVVRIRILIGTTGI